MKIILRADVDTLGYLGDVVTVKPGYARNYLLPQGLAMLATASNQKVFELERNKLQKKMDAVKGVAQGITEKLDQATVIIKMRVGEADKLYGSVTTTHIMEELAAMDIAIDRRKILMPEPLRALGLYELPVKLHPDVQTRLRVAVVRHDWQEGDPLEPEEQVQEALPAEDRPNENASDAHASGEHASDENVAGEPQAADSQEEQADAPEGTASETK